MESALETADGRDGVEQEAVGHRQVAAVFGKNFPLQQAGAPDPVGGSNFFEHFILPFYRQGPLTSL